MNAVCAKLLKEPKISQSYTFQLSITLRPHTHLDGENCLMNRFARPAGVGMLGKSTQLYSRALSRLLIFMPIHLRQWRNTALHSKHVAAEDVRDHLVPPALLEVGENVLHGHLQVFEPHREEPQDAPVAEDERLPDPAEEVRQDEDIAEDVAQVLEVVGVLGDVDAAVRGVVAVGQLHSQRGVEELHELARVVWRQREDEQQETLVDDRHRFDSEEYDKGTQNDLPENRVRTSERSLLELHRERVEDDTWFAPKTMIKSEAMVTPIRMLSIVDSTTQRPEKSIPDLK